MEFLVQETDFSIPELYACYSDRLPLFCVVTKGFQGDIFDECFEEGQVLRLRGPTNVQRVTARISAPNAPIDSETRWCSLPLNRNLMFHTFNWRGKPNSDQSLDDIVSKNKFPINVQLASNQTVAAGRGTLDPDLMTRLTLEGIYTESHLLGNCINSGIIDLRPFTIPLHLWQMRVAIVTGIKGEGQGEWDAYQADINKRLQKAADMFDFDIETQDISVYDYHTADREDHVYHDLDLNLVSDSTSEDSSIEKNPSYEDFDFESTKSPLLGKKLMSPLFREVLPFSVDGRKDHRFMDIKDRQQREHCDRSIDNGDCDASTSDSRKSPNNLTPDVQKAIPKSHGQLERRGSRPRLPLPELPLQPSWKKVSDENVSSLSQTESQKGLQKVKARPRPPPVPPRTKPLSDLKMKDSDTDRIRTTSETKTQLATVSPSQRKAPAKKRQLVKPQTEALSQCGISSDSGTGTSIKDKLETDEIYGLSISELAQYLTRLKLDKYIPKFQSELVDGRVLSQFDSQVLREEFGFSAVESIRLVTFIKDGHIPN